ncbi:MAG: DNA methyltransferase [Thermoleophilia bacterium]
MIPDFDHLQPLPKPQPVHLSGRSTSPKAHLGKPATSVMNLDRKSRLAKALKRLVGDAGELRGGASVYPPDLTMFIVAAHSRPGDLIVDPFAGGGTRAIISAHLGRRYLGLDIRADEVARVNARLKSLGLADLASIEHADATTFDWTSAVGPQSASLVMTCPPYWNLEQYRGGPRDLSSLPTYAAFLSATSGAIDHLSSALTLDAFAVWTLGRLAHPLTNELLDLPGHVEQVHRERGYRTHDRQVVTGLSPAPARTRTFLQSRRSLRNHEEVVVMRYLPLPATTQASTDTPRSGAPQRREP